MRSLIFLAAVLALAPLVRPAAAADPAAMERALRSVVSVLPVWRGLPARDPTYGGGQRAPLAPEGSGVVILPGGYVATNDHVLRDAETVRVRRDDGRILPARIIGRHKETDIALLKVEADLPVFEIAPRPPLAAPVCAIGNQFGLGLSLTCGVVSARFRSGTGFNPIEDFIQTDAAVNPGGSGGALVDRQGRLVGMVSAIFTKESDADIGVNFAASARLLLRVVRDLKDHGKVVEGGIGVEAGPTAAGAGPAGVRVVRVDRHGPALAAGIEAGDLITAVDGRPVTAAEALRTALFLKRLGEKTTLDVGRGKSRRTVTVTVTERIPTR